MPRRTLEYEPTVGARPVVLEYAEGIVRVVVGMPKAYAPVSEGWFEYPIGMVTGPVAIGVSWLVRLLRRTPPPPRAVFEVGTERVRLTMTDPGTGELLEHDWPRSAVAELRASRYSPGLWVNVPGHLKDTLLTDLPPETIRRLEEALRTAFDGDLGRPVAGREDRA